MEVSNLSYPDGYTEPSEGRVGDFEDCIWKSGEVCNNCFQRIRAIGDEYVKRTALFRHKLREYYERTEHGSQEFDPYRPAADRYGQCYCLECGADSRAENESLPTEEMLARAKNMVRYVYLQTDFDINGAAVGRAIHAFKSLWDNTGYDTEIFCVAFCYGVDAANRGADPQPQPA